MAARVRDVEGIGISVGGKPARDAIATLLSVYLVDRSFLTTPDMFVLEMLDL